MIFLSSAKVTLGQRCDLNALTEVGPVTFAFYHVIFYSKIFVFMFVSPKCFQTKVAASGSQLRNNYQ